MDGLNAKQKKFCEEYMIDFNGKQAAIRSGYSEQTAESQASRLLTNVKVASYIKLIQENMSKRAEMTVEDIVKELEKLCKADMRDVARWNESGVRFIPSDVISDDAAGTISEIIETTNQNGGSFKIKQHDKTRALALLMQYKGMLNKREEAAITPQTTVICFENSPKEIHITPTKQISKQVIEIPKDGNENGS